MKNEKSLDRRIREVGRDIFALAVQARPRPWQKLWWLDKGMQWLDGDETLRTRAFQFVDCLPSLRTDADVMRHLSEYFDPRYVDLPPIVHRLPAPGLFHETRATVLGRATQVGARIMAGRFITGYDVPSVLRTLTALRRKQMAFTLDVLGEFTTSWRCADHYAGVYRDLMERLAPLARSWGREPRIDDDAHGPMPRINLSIKLTGLDPHFDAIDPDRAHENVGRRLRPLLRRARELGIFINIDMESFAYRDLTLDLFTNILMEDEFRDFTDVGIVLQAYLVDGERDLARLLDWRARRGHPFAIRLVKGAYWDAETAGAVRAHKAPPVWTRKWETDACYERMVKTMLEHADAIRPAFASHNVRSLGAIYARAESLGLTKRQYEVQMLYGMGDPLKQAMVDLGCCVRVYCPYGDLMPGMGYLIRRLLENTSNEGFLKQSFGDRSAHERLLTDPSISRPPSAPLPTRHYQNSDPEEPMSTFTNASNTNFALAENRQKMLGALAYVRGDVGRHYPMMINGAPVTSEQTFKTHNPARPNEVIGHVAKCTTADVDRAVAAARKSFATWRHTPVAVRADFCRKVADRLEMRRFELAGTMVLEVGKPWREADGDVTEAVDHWRYYADQIERIESRPRLRNIPGEDNMLTYSPKGVCAVISPWAFPLAILSWMTSAALAAGNTVVVKPAQQASVLAGKLIEVLHDVGFPNGTVNFVPGEGSVVGAHLVEHEGVNIVAFAGSRAVGTQVIRAGTELRPGQGFIKKMIVEMGGKNAIIVDDDADMDGAVQGVIESAFAFAGQKCSSCSRLIVLDGIYTAFLDRLGEAVKSIVIGPAEAPSTLVGPVMDKNAQTRIQEFIELGKREGRLLAEATLPGACGEGYFVPPTVIADVEPQSRLAQEEVLGPLLTVLRARSFDHAIEIANNSRYALTGGVYSRSPVHIEQARRDFAVGNLYINRRITGSQVDAQPFGGFRLSGTGVKAGSPDYLLHFMDARCITENMQRSGLVPIDSKRELSQH